MVIVKKDYTIKDAKTKFIKNFEMEDFKQNNTDTEFYITAYALALSKLAFNNIIISYIFFKINGEYCTK